MQNSWTIPIIQDEREHSGDPVTRLTPRGEVSRPQNGSGSIFNQYSTVQYFVSIFNIADALVVITV